jgi:hypothetical protein
MRDYYEFTDLGIVLIQPRAPRSLASSSLPKNKCVIITNLLI